MGARAWVIAGGVIALAVAIVVLVGPLTRAGVSDGGALESTPPKASPAIDRSADAPAAAPTQGVSVIAPDSAQPEASLAPLPAAPIATWMAEPLATNGKDVAAPLERSAVAYLQRPGTGPNNGQ